MQLEYVSLRTFVLCALVACCASAAQAADVISEPSSPRAVLEAPQFTWSGAYLGLQGGGAWATGEFSGFGISSSEDADGGVVGAFAGYNHQFDSNFVAGVEGDIEHNWNEQDILGAEFGMDWAGSARGRIGYAFDHALIYATAGWAATQGYVNVPGLGKDDATFSGYTIGAGLDYAFANNVFGRSEYRYNDYGDEDLQGINVDVDQSTVRVGFGVKFR